MKKQKNKKILRLFGVAGLSLVFGLTACNTNNNNYIDNYVNVEKHSRKNIVYDESTYTITYDSNDFVNNETNINYWLNIINTLIENGYTSAENYLPGTAIKDDVSRTFLFASTYSPSSGYVNYSFNYYQQGPGAVALVLINEANGVYTLNSNISFSSITSEEYYTLFAPVVPPSNNFVGALGTFIQIIVSGIGQLATGVASGIGAMATSLFLNVEEGAVTGLSTFGGIIALFAGIALAITLTTRVYLWITSLGKD